MKIIKFTSKKLDKVYNRQFVRSRRIEEKVKKIIDDVRLFGDEAVLKYTKKFDRVKLTPKQLKVAQIEISGASGANGAVLRVANTAPGIDEGDVRHLFERFWRHDDARTAGSHCGLGLALARACANTLDLDLAAHLQEGDELVFDLSKKIPRSSPPSSSHNLAALY